MLYNIIYYSILCLLLVIYYYSYMVYCREIKDLCNYKDK